MVMSRTLVERSMPSPPDDSMRSPSISTPETEAAEMAWLGHGAGGMSNAARARAVVGKRRAGAHRCSVKL